jgi:hypothetical protein
VEVNKSYGTPLSKQIILFVGHHTTELQKEKKKGKRIPAYEIIA